MENRILWEYLEELPEQETVWHDWSRRLSGWYFFNTFYTHYLKIKDKRAKLLECTTPCEHNCPRRILDKSPSDITAVCPLDESAPIKLTFKDTLIYFLRLETLHQALCVSLQIEYPSGIKLPEYDSVWHLGDYSGTEVYITYRTAILPDTISSLYLLHQKPFILIVPTMKNVTPEIQKFIDKNDFVLLSIQDELRLQPDGSFKPKRSISECMNLVIKAK